MGVLGAIGSFLISLLEGLTVLTYFIGRSKGYWIAFLCGAFVIISSFLFLWSRAEELGILLVVLGFLVIWIAWMVDPGKEPKD